MANELANKPKNNVEKKNDNTQAKPKMSEVLATNSIKELTTSLSLTSEQINRAKSAAFELSTKPELSNCDPYSLVKFCFETARYNFSRTDCIYPVPYGGKVQAQMGYKGFRELCLRSNTYRDINCSEVYDCDKVYRDRETGQIKVIFEEDVARISAANVIGYYAFAIDNDGALTNSLYWSKEKCIEHAKRFSKSYNSSTSIWKEHFEKMAKKTVIKQLCGELKTTPDLEKAIKMDQLVFGKYGEKDEYLDRPSVNSFESKTEVKNTLVEEETKPKDIADDTESFNDYLDSLGDDNE